MKPLHSIFGLALVRMHLQHQVMVKIIRGGLALVITDLQDKDGFGMER